MRKLVSLVVVLSIIFINVVFVFLQETQAQQTYYPMHNHVKIEKYFETHYVGETTITVFIDQPITGSRYAFSDQNIYNAGHSFVRLQYYEPDGYGNWIKQVMYRGFYPTTKMTMEQIIANGDVDGFVSTENFEIGPEWDHVWDVAKVYIVTEDGSRSAQAFIDKMMKSSPKFNTNTENCTKFVVDVLRAADVQPDIHEHSLKFTPFQRTFAAIKGYNINTIPIYSAGDAGEDLRLTNQFLTPGDNKIIENHRILVLPGKYTDYKYFIKNRLIIKYSVRRNLINYMKDNQLKIRPGKYLINEDITFEEVLKIFKFHKIS